MLFKKSVCVLVIISMLASCATSVVSSSSSKGSGKETNSETKFEKKEDTNGFWLLVGFALLYLAAGQASKTANSNNK